MLSGLSRIVEIQIIIKAYTFNNKKEVDVILFAISVIVYN